MNKRIGVFSVAIVLLLGIFYVHFDANPSSDLLTGFTVGGQSRYAQLKACVDAGEQDLTACRLAVGPITPEEFARTAGGGGAGAGGAGGQVIAGAAVAGLPSKEELHRLILTSWRGQRGQKTFLQNYVDTTFLGREPGTPRTFSLYRIQGDTNALLRYAGKKKDIQLLDELAELYLVPLKYLETVSEYQYKYLPKPADGPASWYDTGGGYYQFLKLPLDKPTKIWKAEAGRNIDNTLEASQFLFVVSDAFAILTAIPPAERTENMRRFLDAYTPVLKEHYFRWMYDDHRLYQHKGDNCQGPSESGTNGYGYLQKLLNFQYNYRPSYSVCHYFGDVDMWIATGGANLLRAHEQAVANGGQGFLSAEEKQKLIDYTALATRVMQSRTTESSLTDFNGERVIGYNFGLRYNLEDHPEFGYAGYEGGSFPTEADQRKAETLGWDISHASRFVYSFSALHNARAVTGQTWPDTEDMRRFANQFAYGTFNKDLQRPLFTNYVDGTNGWFLADLETGSGIPPYGSSVSGHAGGWGQWYSFNPDIGKIMASLWKVARSTDVVDQSGNNLAASLGVGTVITPDGKIKGGAKITSQGDAHSIDCGTYPQLRSPIGSFEAWVKFDQEHLGEIQDIARFFEPQGGWYVARAAAPDGRIWVPIRGYVNEVSTYYVNVYSGGTITDANWHHLVVAQDGQKLQIYLDGTLQEATAREGTNPGAWTDFLNMDDPKAICSLGYSGADNAGRRFFGVMDEARFYNKGLSGDEVRAHYQGIFPDQDEHLVAHWNFDSADSELIAFKREFYGSPTYTNFRKREPKEHFQLTSNIMLAFLPSISDIVDASES